ncbi:Cell division protein ZapD, interacts with FtsZ [Mariprofundus aestuarium]|uniref:Cell division protein ZapD, interacts with FtsZ n=1 Tax=Mariprofundus aestuarium TaxID=1921086 RepID=A0A2K8KVP5_MARES|nr:hypothetical protein [Mariprofundus aestuarium]ATX78833.1 Cell division protein ZapD, interacts with FtsZ [Mariprofundus aestuarium]
MSNMVQFSFSLSSRMRSFIELRDALACLESAHLSHNGPAWLHAACDLSTSLLGDHGRKPVVPEVIGLLQDVETYLEDLCKDAPHYQEHIQKACFEIEHHMHQLATGVPDAARILSGDALLSAYLNAQKKHDWLGHKLCLQQSLKAIWKHSDLRTMPLHHALTPLHEAVSFLDSMLNDFVAWKQEVAVGGSGHITPDRKVAYGLLVVSLPEEAVASGIIPDISGNRLAIRIRFQQWLPGEPTKDYKEDQPYAMMLIPIGG